MSAKPKHSAQDNGEPVLVVMGLDDTRKPHASIFDKADAKLASKAAGLMGMRVVKLETAELKALAAKLPRGKVFASGRAFVPFVKASLYASIVAAAGLPAKSPKPARMATASPLDGHSGAGGGDQPPDTAEATPAKGWGDIGAGSLVLATTGPNEGWYEAVVIEVHGDLLKLQWWSWPDEPLFARKISQVGLLPHDPA
ncbi:hypothetical protein [Methylocystis sp. ATCC 49242]|uniref:hypothetical protein n=1 Tax=Methylocystis sp. ATCC 49242 TaxID=622637 RepID=UPI0001F8869C|nr:hypothetical protein [Methylocystis sp. ATCC 49242]